MSGFNSDIYDNARFKDVFTAWIPYGVAPSMDGAPAERSRMKWSGYTRADSGRWLIAWPEMRTDRILEVEMVG